MIPDVAILVVGREPQTAQSLIEAVDETTGGLIPTIRADDAAAAVRAADRVVADGGIVPIAFVDHGVAADEVDVDDVVSMRESASLAATRIVVVPPSASLHEVERALRSGSIDGVITRPWSTDGVAQLTRANLATFLVEHAPHRVADYGAVLDDDELDRAADRVERRRAAPVRSDERPHPLLDTSSEDAELEAQMVDLIDRALGHPPRIRVAPGTILIEQDEDVGGIFVLLDGTVRLTSSAPNGEQILHERSTGSILGLLSLASRRRAVLQCRAVTEVRAIPMTLEQLAYALDVEPELPGLLNRVLIGSLARRLRRSDELQVELDQSLAALSEARAELVSTARLRMLGEVAAGLAHELNNPAAALVRAVEHLLDDVTTHGLLEPDLVHVVQAGYGASAMSTTDARAARRRLTDEIGDRRLADRLVAMGVTELDEALRLARLPAAEFARREAAFSFGRTARDAGSAARRVQALVGTLRAHARGEDDREPRVPDVDLARTVRSALRLLAHRLDDGIEVDAHLADAPGVPGRPGALQSVWSNLLANAIDAVSERTGHDDEPPTVTVDIDHPGADHVRVRIGDNGPGIPPELAERIFEPRFTTKGGRVTFGLGLGLSIARQIVDDHGGTITVESRPGRTVFTVRLPLEEPGE